MDITSIIINFLASLGGATGITVILIKSFGNKILEAQFEKSIENYKFKINSKFDRISKIHEKEFEVLPKLWQSIILVNSNLYKLSKPLQTYPDFNIISKKEKDEFYRSIELRESDIEKIEQAYDKNKQFVFIDYNIKLRSISSSLNEFNQIFILNRIFLTNNMEEKILIIQKTFKEIFVELDNALFNDVIDFNIKQNAYKKQNEISDVIEQIGDQIQNRLGFEYAFV